MLWSCLTVFSSNSLPSSKCVLAAAKLFLSCEQTCFSDWTPLWTTRENFWSSQDLTNASTIVQIYPFIHPATSAARSSARAATHLPPPLPRPPTSPPYKKRGV